MAGGWLVGTKLGIDGWGWVGWSYRWRVFMAGGWSVGTVAGWYSRQGVGWFVL